MRVAAEYLRGVADNRWTERATHPAKAEQMAGEIVFLCCCSNRKLTGGERAYRPANSVPLLVPRKRRALLEARQFVFQGIQDGARTLQGTPLRDLPYNAEPQLVGGPDLGGKANGRYMPAMARYRGRFYQELDPGEMGFLSESPHHWLITSALYGLLTPEEPIQRYSCHTLDDETLTEVWTKDGLLTSVLLAYVRASGADLIVDLLADASYQDLFDWERVSRHVQVLRAFGAQNAGPGLLPALGFLARVRLLQIPRHELFEIAEHETYITDYEDVVLTRSYRGAPESFMGIPSPPDEPVLPSAEDCELPARSREAPGADEECVVLPRPREIMVTSGGHGTMFGYQINHIRDLPPDTRRLFDQVSRVAEVLDVRLGPFTSSGATRNFTLDLSAPGHGSDGIIEAKLRGPGRIGGTQRIRIRVTPGRELATYQTLVGLLTVNRR